MKKIKILILIGFLIAHDSFGQDCSKNLEMANRAYYDGQFENVIELVEPCVQQKIDTDEKQDILHLLINAYLLLENEEKADQHMASLLRLNPYYQNRSSDLIEFAKLYNDYSISPKFTYGFTLGINKPDYLILQHQSIASETNEPMDYDEVLGFVLGVTGDYAIWKNLFASASLLLQSASFEQAEEILDYQRVFSREREIVISVPLQLKYGVDIWKVRPFVGAGISVHKIISSTADLDHTPLPSERVVGRNLGNSFQTSGYDMMDQRINIRNNLVASVGIQYQKKDFLLELKFNYERGLKNLVDPDNRFTDDVLIDTYAYVPDDFKVDNFYLNLSVSRVISKIRKK